MAQIATAEIDIRLDGLRRAVSGLQRMRGSLNRAGRVVNRMAPAVRNLTAAFVGLSATGLAFAIREGAQFEQRMKGVEVAGQRTAEQMEALEATARELGETTQFSATQAAEAFEEFAKAGLDTQTSIEAITPALNIAAAGELRIADAAGVAVRTLKQFRLEADDLNKVADTMVTTFQNSLTTVQDLGNAMRFAGSFAKQAGLNFEETTAAIGLMQDAGLKATQAGRNMRQILIKLVNPTKEGQRVLNRFGIELRDNEGELKSLTGILREFEQGMSDLGETAKAGELAKVFPAEAVGGFLALLQQGSSALDEFLEKFRTDTGRAADVAEEKLNTLQGAFIRVKSAAGELAIAITNAFGPDIESGVENFIELIRKLGSLVKTNTEGIRSAIDTLQESFVSGFDKMIRIVRFFQGVWFTLKAAIAGVLGLVGRGVKKVIDVLVDQINKALKAVEAIAFAIPGVPDQLGETARDARQALEANLAQMEGFVDGLANTFEEAGDKAAKAFTDAFAARSPSQKIKDALDFPAPIDLTRPGGRTPASEFPRAPIPGTTGAATGQGQGGLLQGALDAMIPRVSLDRDAARRERISEQINAMQAVADAVKEQTGAAQANTDAQRRASGNIGRAVQRQAQAQEEAQDLREQTRTSEERFRQRLGRIRELFQGGFIGRETATRAIGDLRSRLFGNPEGPGRMGGGVVTSASSVQSQIQQQIAESPTERKNLKANEKAAKFAEAIANNTEKLLEKGVKAVPVFGQ